METNLLNTQYATGGNFNLNALQNMLQFELFSKVKTNNPIIDSIVMYAIFMCVAGILSNFKPFFGYIFNKIFSCFDNMRIIIMYFYRKIKKEKKVFEKHVNVDFLDQQKQYNYLFKAVHWFLCRNDGNDFTKETPLLFTYGSDITTDNSEIVSKKYTINKSILNNRWKEISFNGYIIKYLLCSSIETIYNGLNDHDVKRENFQIKLSVLLEENVKTDILDIFCKFCVDEYVKNLSSPIWEQKIFVNKDDKWISSPSKNFRRMDTVILKDGIKDKIQDDINLFIKSEDWYKSRGISYSRGYLLYGSPGTGKTSLIKALSNYCKRHIHTLMLSSIISDAQLLDLLKDIKYNETILVIEDIDCAASVVNDRSKIVPTVKKSDEENNKDNKMVIVINNKGQEHDIETTKQNSGKLTLSGILNAIDGVFNNDGRILVMTTNHMDNLDDALIRPGRIDMRIIFDNCDKEQIAKLYETYFDEKCPECNIKNFEDYKYSPAFITNLFMQYRNNPHEIFNHLS